MTINEEGDREIIDYKWRRDRKRERKGDEERQTNINKERENGRYVYKINVIKTLKNKLSILTDKKDLIYNIKNI